MIFEQFLNVMRPAWLHFHTLYWIVVVRFNFSMNLLVVTFPLIGTLVMVTTSQDQNPAHTYLSPRVEGYDITLEVLGLDDCRDEFAGNIVITGQDETQPILICPVDTVIDCTVEVIPANTGELIVMDNCGINDIEITFTDEVTTEVACTRVIKRTWAVVDKANNINTCEQIISVVDLSGPVISNCPGGISVNSDLGRCGADVNIIPPIADDSCNRVISLTNDYTNTNIATSFYPVGTTIVTWTALDDCGNVSATCSHSVTVIDNEAPTIECIAGDTTIQATRGALGALFEFSLPNRMDNCSADLVGSHQSGDFFPCGETIVTYNAVDPAGNLSETCVFTITVECDLDIDFAGVDCGMAVTTRYSGNRTENDPSKSVLELIDIRTRDFAAANQNQSDQFNILSDPRWTAFNLGELFGTAIDDQDFVYVASTSIYPENYFGANQENTGGEIYRINTNTGEVELFQQLPNSGQGLGNLCFANHKNGRYPICNKLG